jgi:type IV fimbrial biogenesis protein FimT
MKDSMRRRKACSGFTMIELLVTSVIIAALAAIAIPGFSVWLPDYRLKRATRDVFSNLQLAKMQAIRSNGQYAVAFNPGGQSYQVVDCGADDTYGTVDDVTEKTVLLADYGSGVVFGKGSATKTVPGTTAWGDFVTYPSPVNVATFNSRGIGTGGYVYLTNTKNRAYAVGTQTSGVILLRKWRDASIDWE